MPLAHSAGGHLCRVVSGATTKLARKAPPVCDRCTSTPQQLQVVIAGMVASQPEVCTDCLDLNGTYVLDYLPSFVANCTAGFGGAANCCWGYTLSPAICTSLTKIVAWFLAVPSGRLAVDIGSGTNRWMRWYVNLSVPTDCTAWSDLELANFVNEFGGCNYKAPPGGGIIGPPTCFVTSL